MKLVFNPGAGECHWIDGNYSDTSAAGQWYLFNLTSDPRETHDLKGELPRLFVELQAAHKLWVESVQASRSNETLCDRTPPPAPPGPPGVCLFPYPPANMRFRFLHSPENRAPRTASAAGSSDRRCVRSIAGGKPSALRHGRARRHPPKSCARGVLCRTQSTGLAPAGHKRR